MLSRPMKLMRRGDGGTKRNGRIKTLRGMAGVLSEHRLEERTVECAGEVVVEASQVERLRHLLGSEAG